MSKLPSDFPDIDLPAWQAALPMPATRPLALRRNAQSVLDAIIKDEPKATAVSRPLAFGMSDYEIAERAFAAAKPGDPFHARGLRRRK